MQVSKGSAKTTLKVSRDPTWFRLYEIRGRLQKKIGHSDLGTTEVYLHLNQQEAVEEVKPKMKGFFG